MASLIDIQTNCDLFSDNIFTSLKYGMVANSGEIVAGSIYGTEFSIFDCFYFGGSTEKFAYLPVNDRLSLSEAHRFIVAI